MFQMLVLAKGQTNLLRVPAGAGRWGADVGVPAGLGVPADPPLTPGVFVDPLPYAAVVRLNPPTPGSVPRDAIAPCGAPFRVLPDGPEAAPACSGNARGAVAA
jgi:hypothetical protein